MAGGLIPAFLYFYLCFSVRRALQLLDGGHLRILMEAVVEDVNRMTPENIHLNSFMYEPILDMSNEYLKQLYGNVAKL